MKMGLNWTLHESDNWRKLAEVKKKEHEFNTSIHSVQLLLFEEFTALRLYMSPIAIRNNIPFAPIGHWYNYYCSSEERKKENLIPRISLLPSYRYCVFVLYRFLWLHLSLEYKRLTKRFVNLLFCRCGCNSRILDVQCIGRCLCMSHQQQFQQLSSFPFILMRQQSSDQIIHRRFDECHDKFSVRFYSLTVLATESC